MYCPPNEFIYTRLFRQGNFITVINIISVHLKILKNLFTKILTIFLTNGVCGHHYYECRLTLVCSLMEIMTDQSSNAFFWVFLRGGAYTFIDMSDRFESTGISSVQAKKGLNSLTNDKHYGAQLQ